MGTSSNPTKIAPLLARQRGAAVACMTDCGLSLGGYSGLALAHAYCDEALARPQQLQILIASEGEEVLGFLVVLHGPWSFWRGFLGRHPWLALQMGLFALRPQGKPSGGVPAMPWEWSSSSPLCLRVLMIAVAPASRRQGLARALYGSLFTSLKGVEREKDLWALVMPDNAPSQALHREMGWVLGGEEGDILATWRPA